MESQIDRDHKARQSIAHLWASAADIVILTQDDLSKSSSEGSSKGKRSSDSFERAKSDEFQARHPLKENESSGHKDEVDDVMEDITDYLSMKDWNAWKHYKEVTKPNE